jgi:hypothetical protein
MIFTLAAFVVAAWVLSTDWMLELAAGASLIALPLSIISGDWSVAGTSLVLLIVTIWVMVKRPLYG